MLLEQKHGPSPRKPTKTKQLRTGILDLRRLEDMEDEEDEDSEVERGHDQLGEGQYFREDPDHSDSDDDYTNFGRNVERGMATFIH